MNRGIGEIAGEMRKSQAFGALEIMILSPTRLPTPPLGIVPAVRHRPP